MAVVLRVSIVSLLFVFLLHPCISTKCGPVDKDIKVLTEQNYWHFEHPNTTGSCQLFEPENKTENVSSTCIFYFSICKPVPRYCPDNSGICLANKVSFSKQDTTLYSEFVNIGTYTEKFTSGADYFTLAFKSGAFVLERKMAYYAVLRFECHPNATWSGSTDGKVPFQPSVSLIKDKYAITFFYSGACKGGGHGGSGDQGPPPTLSIGSILLILFFPGMFLYCVVGALVRKGNGKTGKDVIPHAQFLSDLPGLIAVC